MSDLGYNVVERNGKPAKSRFTDPAAFAAIYSRLTDDDAVEAVRRAKIRRMYDGNLPYDPAKLAQCGLKNIANVNFLGLKGVIDNRSDAVLKLASDTTNLVEVHPLSREIAGPEAEKISAVVAEEFSRTLRETGKIIPALSMMNREADLYGIGPVAWPTDDDYNPVALERGQIRFIPDGPVNSSQHELVMFESQLPAHYLFYLLDHPAEAEAEGWNVPAVKRWVVDAFYNNVETRAQPGVENNTTYIESNLALMRQNRFEEEHQFDRFNVIHAFVKEMEFPRGITHLIAPASERKDFLFRRQHAYSSMDECFLWFPFSCNERYARAVRGLASFLYPIEALNNRFTCQMVDVAFRAASFVLAQKTAGAQQNLTINEQGPYTVIPAEYAPAQSQVAPNIQQLAQMKQILDSVGVNSVTGADKGQVGTTGVKMSEGSSRQTKAEVEIQQRLRSHKEEALFVQRLTVFDKIFRETFRRFIRLATSPDPTKLADYPEIVTFIERCSRRGVDVNVLAQVPQMFTIVTCRDLILGSEGVVGVLNELLSAYGGTFDDAGRKSAVRQMLKLRLGNRHADSFMPELSRDQSPSDQSSFATLENDMMKQGLPTQVGSDQWHWAHIPVHTQVLKEIVDQVAAPEDNSPETDSFGNPQQPDGSIGERTLQNVGNDPRRILNVLVTVSQHVQGHLAVGGQQIGKDQDAKKVAKMLRDLRPTVKALNLAVATQERVEQAEKEKQEREMEDLRRKASEAEVEKARYETDRKAEIEMYRADKDHEVALRRLELEGQERGERSAAESRRSDEASARADREAQAKIERDEKLNDARVNAANALNRMNAVQGVTGFEQTRPEDLLPDDGSADYSDL